MASLTSTDILNRETHVATSTVPEQLRDESGEFIIEQFEVPFEDITWINNFIRGPISLRVLNAFYGNGSFWSCCEGPEDQTSHCDCEGPDCSCIPRPTGCCFKPPVFTWRVYLTEKSVKFVSQLQVASQGTLCCVASSTINNSNKCVFALTEIADIQVLANPISAGYGKLGTEIAEPTTIVIEIKPERAKDFINPCYRCCNLPTVIQISCKRGASDFVRAVKRQMLIMARE